MNTPIRKVVASSDHNPSSPSRKRLALDDSEDKIMGAPVILETIMALFQSTQNENAKMFASVHSDIANLESNLEAKLEAKIGESFQAAVNKLDEKWGEKLEHFDNMIKQANDKINRLNEEKSDLGYQLEEVENKFRRNNLIFTGLSTNNSNSEDCTRLVTDLCAQVLGIPSVYVNRAHKMPINKHGKRDIVAHFPNDPEIQLILKNAPKLKGKNIFIRKDLVGHAANVDLWFRRLGKTLKEMKVFPKFGVGTMFVGNKRFTVDRTGNLMCGRDNGCDVLSEDLKVDMQAIWTRITTPNRYMGDNNSNGME